MSSVGGNHLIWLVIDWLSKQMRHILVICGLLIAVMAVNGHTTQSLPSLPTNDDPFPNCVPCKAVAELIVPVVRANATREVVYNLAVFACEIIKPECNTTAACKDLCLGVVKEHLDMVLEIALKTVLSPSELCWFINLCPAPPPPPKPSGDVPVPSNCTDRSGERQWPTWDQHGSGYFVQISDLHVDMKYTPGSNSVCGEPLCCREVNGPGNASWNTAGQFGDYHCDLPYPTAESLFQHLASLKPPPDFILYTGDDPPHDIWEQSREWNLLAITKVNGLMNQYLPNVPIFSAVGNHEAYPVNQFEGPPFDDWLNSALASGWAHYLPTDALHTLRYAGYYTARARPGLRVISLNSNYYSSGNFWLVANNTDYSSQLPWMKDVLKQARALKEKVIIIGHGASSGWVDQFSDAYNTIIEDYKDIVIGQFHGHAHSTDLRIFRDNATDSQPWNIAYIVGSVVPYSNLNPGWRKYYYDRDVPNNYIAQDFEQYWMDIDQANALGKITDWGTVRYKATDFYGMKDCSPQSWQSAIARAFVDDKIWHHHLEAYFRGEQKRQGKPNRIGMLCDAYSYNQASWHACHDHHYKALYGALPTNEVRIAEYQQHMQRESHAC